MAPAAKTSLARGLELLKVILEGGEMRADELAGAMQMPVSTVYRYLRDLRAAGLVLEERGVNRPGPALLASRGTAAVSPTELRRLARPALEQLAARSGETAILAVRAHARAVCLDQVESTHPVRLAFAIGQPLPLYAGATACVLLAYAPADVVSAVLGAIESLTPATPSASQLSRRLAAVRRDEIAVSRGELVPGAYAVAVPVLAGERCVCALSLAAPVGRATEGWRTAAPAQLAQARRLLEALVS